ncbi:MAG: hypothetical protein M0006_14960 [Magnetospirillum sp.]|nr:hypothetical protein [Magnetospirillum sp.]
MASPKMTGLALALFAVTFVTPAAFAATSTECDGNCRARLDRLDRAITNLPAPQKPGGGVFRGPDGIMLTGGQVTFMRDQVAAAARDCRDGKESQADMRMATVHALL